MYYYYNTLFLCFLKMKKACIIQIFCCGVLWGLIVKKKKKPLANLKSSMRITKSISVVINSIFKRVMRPLKDASH